MKHKAILATLALLGGLFFQANAQTVVTDTLGFDKAMATTPATMIQGQVSGVRVSPIDGNVVPYPWDMPGYQDQVIMAAGTFVGGASIELSADAPIKEPYIAYLQGALTYEHAYIAAEACLRAVTEVKHG